VSEGLLGSAQSLLASLLGLARTRLDLLSTELQEALAHVALGVVAGCAALLLAALGLVFGGIAVLLAIAPDQRVAAAVAMALIYLAAAAAVAFALRRRERPRVFEATVEELQRDREALTQ
jgi:uncharacterized membrane protein YqjE